MGLAMKLEHIRAEIERMRHQISRQRKDIQSLQRAGMCTLPAEALLAPADAIAIERGELLQKYEAWAINSRRDFIKAVKAMVRTALDKHSKTD
jgi:hypothetical protein